MSLFVALALLVGKTKEEVHRVIAAHLDQQWLLGIDDITDKAVLGVGLEMGKEPWRLIGGGDSSLQPLVV